VENNAEPDMQTEIEITNFLEEFDVDELNHRVESDLKGKGFIVIPATQYGFDYALYEKHPSECHASHLVHIIRVGDDLSMLELVRAGRVAHTVRKNILFAIPTKDSVRYLEAGWWNGSLVFWRNNVSTDDYRTHRVPEMR